jgi:hypothetical protein
MLKEPTMTNNVLKAIFVSPTRAINCTVRKFSSRGLGSKQETASVYLVRRSLTWTTLSLWTILMWAGNIIHYQVQSVILGHKHDLKTIFGIQCRFNVLYEHNFLQMTDIWIRCAYMCTCIFIIRDTFYFAIAYFLG